MARGVLTVGVLVSGCSLAMDVPPSPPTRTPYTCSRALPIIDTVAAVPLIALGTLGLASLATKDGRYWGGVVLAYSIPPLVVGIAYAVAAGQGYGAAARCRELNAQFRPHLEARLAAEATRLRSCDERRWDRLAELATVEAPQQRRMGAMLLPTCGATAITEDAWRLTREAVVAAVDGDCVRVRSLVGQLRSVNPAHYQRVMSTDLDIRACMPHE